MKPRRPIKKADNRIKYAAAAVSLLILFVIAAVYYFSHGTGASEPETSTSASAPTTAKPAAPVKEMTDAEREELIQAQIRGASAKTAAKSTRSTEGEESASPSAHPKPDFPADLAKWTPDHFRLAREKRNPKIVQAVRQLGRGNDANPDANENAHLLAELLAAGSQSTALAADASADSEGASTTIPGLGPSIVETLGVNGSDDARAVLKRILLGKQPSDSSDHVLTMAALRAIINHPDEENQHILEVLLVVPDTVRPAGRGEVTADQLQEECLRLVKPIANSDFRLQLAKRINQGSSSPNNRRRVIAMLTSAEPANLSAQVELLVDGQLDPTILGRIDVQLGQSAEQILDALLHASLADWATKTTETSYLRTAGEDNPGHDLTFNDLVQLAHQVWRPEFGQALAVRIDGGDSSENNLPLLTLASTLPDDTIRKSLQRHLEAVALDDNTAGQYSELFSGGVRDPGLILVLKELPREAPNEKHQTSSGKTNSKSGNPAKETVSSKEQLARQTWLKISEKFVHDLVDRFTKAEVAHQRAANSVVARRLSPDSSDEFDSLIDAQPQTKRSVASPLKLIQRNEIPADVDLGFKLHDGASVKTARNINWPADLHSGLEKVATSRLAIQYVKLTSESDIESVAHFYQNELKTAVLRTVSKGRWVDSVTKLDDGQVRSVDVLITRAVPGSPPPRGTPEKINVDILSVQILDPQDRSKGDDTAVSSDSP